jgi:hypothetical protein
MNSNENDSTAFQQIDLEVLQDLTRRVTDIDNTYRAVAEKVGQLYMKADDAGLNDVTELLDKPMRNASDNQQSFAELLGELQSAIRQRA